MSDEIFFDGHRYVSAAHASSTAALTRDYIARLCRDGKVRGRRIGKNWYVDEESLRQFVVEKEYTKARTREELSRARAEEYVSAHQVYFEPPAHKAQSAVGTGTSNESSVSADIRRPIPVTKTLAAHATHVRERLRTKALAHGEHVMRLAPSVLASPTGAHEALARTIGHGAIHVPVYTLTPVAEFVQKFLALVVAFTMTFGTYALVDPTYARFAMDSMEGSIASLTSAYMEVTGGGTTALATRSRERLYFAAENPKVALAQASGASLSFFPNAMRNIARAINSGIDEFVYAIAFPSAVTDSHARVPQDRATVSIEVAPYARGTQGSQSAMATPSGSSGSIVNVTSPAPAPVTIVERLIETERIVSQVGGISEEYLNQRLALLENQLSSRLMGSSAGGGNTTISNNYAVIAQSNKIDKLGSVDIENSTFTDGTISGSDITNATITGSSFAGSVAATTLSASATSSLATTTITGSLDVSGALSVGSFAFSSASTTDITFIRATGTSATTTNLFSTLATITGLTATNSTTTSATTTNLFSTTASSTNLYSSVAQFGSLSVLGALTQTGLGTFTNGFLSQASSTVVGNFTSTGTGTFANGAFTASSGTTTIAAGQGFTIGGSKFVVQESSGNIGIGTSAPTTGLDVGVTTRVTGDLTIAGGSALTISASGPINQTGTGQVTFAGNLDATNGLDVTNANFTVGGSNFIVAQATGNTTIAGTLGLTGALSASSTLQVTGASRLYDSLRVDGALTASAAGTGLSVTNNASIGGTLALTGAATFGSTLSVSGLLSAATTTFTGNVALSGKKITGLGSPTADEDAANKTYVDSVAQGLSLKDSVAAGTTANITLSGEQTIDGVSLVAGDRVLVKDQADETKNGIYVVAAGVWSRATDADADSEVTSGMFTFVTDGTANASSGWVLTTTGAITLGTTQLNFTQFSGAGQIIAGSGITKSSNTLDVVGTANRITANADSIDIASTYVGQSSITTVGALTSGSIGSGFGNINIGASSITGGVATFSSIVGSAINGTGDLTISGSGTFSNGLTIVGTLSAATTTFSGNVALGGKKITGLADPTSAQEAATKAYVDAIAQGLTVKAAVRVATTSSITLSGTQTIDGVAVVAGDRVLVMGQSTASQNGIYTAAAGAWSRATDADENSEVTTGMYSFVEEGTAYANTGWSLITSGSITLDTTSLSFSQFSGSAETTGGDGLTKTGNTLNVVGTAGRITATADAIDIASTYVGQSSITTVGTLTSGSIGSGFGAINIGSSALTAGTSIFATTTSFGTLSIGSTATTSIVGNSATSTFSGGISLAAGNVNIATGGNFLINDALILNATGLGSSVLSSSLTSVGPLDSGSITTGFGAINIGSDTLDAGATTLASLTVSAGATTTNLFSTTASSTNLYSSAAQFGSLSVLGALTQTGLGTFANGFLSQASSTVVGAFTTTGTNTFAGALNIAGAITSTATTANTFPYASTTALSVSGTAYFPGSGIWNSSGSVGIGTTSPSVKLSVYGDVFLEGSSRYLSFGTATGTSGYGFRDNAGTIQFKHGGGDWADVGSGAGVTGTIGQLAYLSDTDTLAATSSLYLATNGNFGIGTTSPFRKFSVTHAVATAQVAVSYDTTRNTDLLTDSSGDLTINPSGDDVRLSDDNLWVCAAGSCPSGTPTGNGNLVVETALGVGTSTPMWAVTASNSSLPQLALTDGTETSYAWAFRSIGNNLYIATSTASATSTQSALLITSSGRVGIGTTTPSSQLAVQGLLTVGAGSNAPVTMGTATSTFNGDIKILGKLDVSTIDPVYTIDGIKYATYGHSTVGIKEEMMQTIHLAENADGTYSYTIDFDAAEKGSDLWLFYQITDFGKDWSKLVVSLTPAFDGTVHYEKNVQDNTLTILGDSAGEVSMRLVGSRYDFSKWPNLRTDQDGDTRGTHVISGKSIQQ